MADFNTGIGFAVVTLFDFKFFLLKYSIETIPFYKNNQNSHTHTMKCNIISSKVTNDDNKIVTLFLTTPVFKS